MPHPPPYSGFILLGKVVGYGTMLPGGACNQLLCSSDAVASSVVLQVLIKEFPPNQSQSVSYFQPWVQTWAHQVNTKTGYFTRLWLEDFHVIDCTAQEKLKTWPIPCAGPSHLTGHEVSQITVRGWQLCWMNTPPQLYLNDFYNIHCRPWSCVFSVDFPPPLSIRLICCELFSKWS